MFDWVIALFSATHTAVFEAVVLPLVYELGLGGYAEQAFDWTELALIGLIEIALMVVVLGSLEKWRPVDVAADAGATRVDMLYTALHRLGVIPLVLFVLLSPAVETLDGWLRMHDRVPVKLEDLWPGLHAWPLGKSRARLVGVGRAASGSGRKRRRERPREQRRRPSARRSANHGGGAQGASDVSGAGERTSARTRASPSTRSYPLAWPRVADPVRSVRAAARAGAGTFASKPRSARNFLADGT